MPAVHAFDYAIVRVAPRPEREEFINAGVVLFCRPLRFLGCRLELDEQRLLALAPDCDVAAVRAQLELIQPICAGGPAAGDLAELDQAERFRWLVAPRSTVIQVSPVHNGLCDDPPAALDDLYERLVQRTAGNPVLGGKPMTDESEFYPMPSFPMLSVDDLAASTQWYQDALGFRLVFTMPGHDGQPILTHLRWARYADLLLVQPWQRPAEPRGVGVSLNFSAPGGQTTVDALAERARQRGALLAAGPADTPWNTREVTVLDPNGYRLVFSEPVNMQMTMDEVVHRVQAAML